MAPQIVLPVADGLRPYLVRGQATWPSIQPAAESRTAYAAAHVVADPRAANGSNRPAAVDWAATMAFRHYLWRLGLGVADAMDTAQRGMGLDWTATRELIHRSGVEAKSVGGRLVCGAGTDQLPAGGHSLADVVAAYEEQLAVVEAAGSDVVLMASRALVTAARGPEDYLSVYGRLLRQCHRPVILHWLGPMFDPALTGYWGSADLDRATATVIDLVNEHADRIDGIKLSLLDADREKALRQALPAGVRLYTGDDFNYPELIRGDEHGHSHALLGIFDAIAAPAAAALRALDAGDLDRYDAIMAPTVPLARTVFATPTFNYKTGIVFLAWLSGHQEQFRMVGGLERARDARHLAELFRLADAANLLPDPDLATARMRALLAELGVDA